MAHGIGIIRRNYLGKTSILTLATLLALPTQAWAQDEEGALESGDSEEVSLDPVDEGNMIIVTAQRRVERLQDVPIAITALGSEELTARGINDLADLAAGVPGLAITGFAGVNASNLVSMRGVSGQLAPIGASQATAIYLDGVYLSLPDAAFFGLNDIERIEVLRGPQGTLYGRNATAGAINIITRTPSDEVEGGVNFSYGNYNEFMARGSFSGPIADDLFGGIAMSYDDRDGYFRNLTTGNRIGDRSSLTVRGQLHFDRGTDFDATLSADYTEIRGPDIFKNGFTNGVYTGLGDPDVLTNNEESRIFGRTEIGGAALVVNLEAGDDWVITSLSSWRTVSRQDGYDIDGSDLLSLYVDSAHSSETLNQEVRAVYTGDRLRATIGGNYFNDDADFGFIVNPPDRANPRARLSPYDTSDLQAYALFTQVEFDLTDWLEIVGGLRYNYETRDFTVDYSNGPVPGNFVSGNVSDSVLLPMAGVNIEVAPDILIYGKYSQGYQAPGFGFVPGPTAPANIFFAETLDAFELGFKSQLFDRRLTFNAAAFYYEYSDLQVRTQIREGQVGITNAADASIKGVEAELVYRPTDIITLSAHATRLDATYGTFCESVSVAAPLNGDPTCVPPGATLPTGADRGGNFLNNAPKWSGGATLQVNAPLSDSLTLNFTTSFIFETTSYFHAANGFGRNFGWERWDARLGLELANGLEIYVYGRNLTDDRYCAFCLQQSNLVLSQSISAPRTYGVGAQFRF